MPWGPGTRLDGQDPGNPRLSELAAMHCPMNPSRLRSGTVKLEVPGGFAACLVQSRRPERALYSLDLPRLD